MAYSSASDAMLRHRYGILGIALTKKARARKHQKRRLRLRERIEAETDPRKRARLEKKLRRSHGVLHRTMGVRRTGGEILAHIQRLDAKIAAETDPAMRAAHLRRKAKLEAKLEVASSYGSYGPASDAMLSHRYGPHGAAPHAVDANRLSDVVATAMFGSLPTAGSGRMQLQPVPAPGIDTGTIHLVPLAPDPELTPGAEEGIEMGFAQFMKEYRGPGR